MNNVFWIFIMSPVQKTGLCEVREEPGSLVKWLLS